MSDTTCHMSISLDGFVAGPEQSREHPLIPLEYDAASPNTTILGQIVWSWSCFNGFEEDTGR